MLYIKLGGRKNCQTDISLISFFPKNRLSLSVYPELEFLNKLFKQLSLPIIKRHLCAKIGKSTVQRRKVKCQLKVCQIEKLKISLNRVRQDRYVLLINFFNSIISFRNNIWKWKKKLREISELINVILNTNRSISFVYSYLITNSGASVISPIKLRWKKYATKFNFKARDIFFSLMHGE